MRHIFCQRWQELCSSHLFLIILCTIASVVRLFPLSTVRRIPFLLGSCVRWKHHKMSLIYHLSVLHRKEEDRAFEAVQHKGRIHPCQDIFLSSHDTQDPPTDKKISCFILSRCGACYDLVVRDAETNLEMVQQISGDCKRSTNHHFWNVLLKKKSIKSANDTRSVNVWCAGNVLRIKNNVLDKPRRWASFRGRSWWGSSFPCNDLPPVKHKLRVLQRHWRSRKSCNIM